MGSDLLCGPDRQGGALVNGGDRAGSGGEKETSEAEYDQAALEKAAQRGFDNALFEHHEEEVAEIVDEFNLGAPGQPNGSAGVAVFNEASLVKIREIKARLTSDAADARHGE